MKKICCVGGSKFHGFPIISIDDTTNYFFSAQCEWKNRVLITYTYILMYYLLVNKGLCTELIRAIQQYFASLPFDHGVQAHQSGLQPQFSGLCTRTDQSHLAVFSIDRNAIGCYDFVQIGKTFQTKNLDNYSNKILLNPSFD